jgi:hypothetical protein
MGILVGLLLLILIHFVAFHSNIHSKRFAGAGDVSLPTATAIVRSSATAAVTVVHDVVRVHHDHDNETHASASALQIQATTQSVETQTRSPLPLMDNGLADPWRHPVGSHCYQRGNDWSACAGDHLLYPKISDPQELWKREQPMCLYEPLCWKQLDWRNMAPPTPTCTIERNIRFYDWSLHDGTMASPSATIEKAMANATNRTLEVFLCNGKSSQSAIRNYHYNFKQCPTHPPFINTWATRGSDQIGNQYYNWLKHAPHAQQADAHITGFIPPMFEFLMALNRTIVMNALHRVNMHRCSHKESRQTFLNLVRLASSGPSGRYPNAPIHIIAPGYVHDVEYIRHYTGIRPIYLPFSLLNLLPTNKYTGENKNAFIWNGAIHPPNQLTANYQMTTPTKYELSDLLKYRGAIVTPYSITNTKSLEQYEMNIPMFVPTPGFAIELGLFDDRTATYSPYCQGAKFTDADHPAAHESSPYEFSPNARKVAGDSAEAEEFWISFSEVYVWPCVEYFNSWSDLVSKLDAGTDDSYRATSQCMMQANQWRKYELDTNLCWVLQHISRYPAGAERSLTSSSYSEALAELYGGITSAFQ